MRAKKALGQHFVVDSRVLARIVKSAELTSQDTVVEVGPGRGSLTRELASRAGRVVAIEVDQELVTLLQQGFGDSSNVTIVHADAREVDLGLLVSSDVPYKVVANLPYYAASPIIRRFLEAQHKPGLMVVMVQREVARNMVASPGQMGLLSVAIQLYGRPRIIGYAPPRAFRPSPKVTSAIVRIDVYPQPLLALDSVAAFFQVVRAGFSAPRKQLRNALSHALNIAALEIEALLTEAGIDPKRRAQTLRLEEWGTLYQTYRDSYVKTPEH